ncbi:hypothetical protein, partial [Coxiella burnetii]|uniref:hypothetical protein n=1 Tax=Coxiella burnetii TaxID=777 RepID=UPI00222E29D9
MSRKYDPNLDGPRKPKPKLPFPYSASLHTGYFGLGAGLEASGGISQLGFPNIVSLLTCDVLFVSSVSS